MDKTWFYWLALMFIWVGGVFFGRMYERKLFERNNRKKNTNDSAQNPLPMENIKTPNSIQNFGE